MSSGALHHGRGSEGARGLGLTLGVRGWGGYLMSLKATTPLRCIRSSTQSSLPPPASNRKSATLMLSDLIPLRMHEVRATVHSGIGASGFV